MGKFTWCAGSTGFAHAALPTQRFGYGRSVETRQSSPLALLLRPRRLKCSNSPGWQTTQEWVGLESSCAVSRTLAHASRIDPLQMACSINELTTMSYSLRE